MVLGVRSNPERGRIGRWSARVWWDEAGERLRLRWRGREFDLREEVVRHRDDGGAVVFSVGGVSARYRRKGPSARDLFWDSVDFTADEPWTWEDSDFGLFVFHLATNTGPMKYRHHFPFPPVREDQVRHGLAVSEEGLTRRLPGVRVESVRWDRLREIRAKFEISGIYADPVLLVLDDGEGLAVVPVGFGAEVDRVRAEIVPWLRRLPGWQDEPLEVALAYAERSALGPGEGETRDDWAERAVWSRPDG